jgi:hypothetical protein
MFWDDELQALEIRGFLDCTGRFGAKTLFNHGKSTDLFFRTYKRRGVFSHGELKILEIALDFWNGRGNTRLSELYTLSPQERKLTFSLYQALCDSAQAVQDWIDSHIDHK